jgi:hypothetical protein
MAKTTIKKHAITLDIPRSLAQVPLSRYIDFLIACREMEKPDVNQAAAILNAVSTFFGADNEALAQLEYMDSDNKTVALLQLFGFIVGLTSAPTDNQMRGNTFEYKGEVYEIPYFVRDAITGREMPQGVSTIQMIEASEVQRMIDASINSGMDRQFMERITDMVNVVGLDNAAKAALLAEAERQAKQQAQEANDPDGSKLYTGYVRTLAILCRKPGEHLPISDTEREAWINRRATHFADINAKTALDVDFFLTSFLQFCGKTLLPLGFLSRQSVGNLVSTLSSRQKRKRRPKNGTKRYTGE